MQSPFVTTNRHSENPAADYFASRALALAFAVVGRLIAEDVIEVDLSEPEWELRFMRTVQAVADVIRTYESEN